MSVESHPKIVVTNRHLNEIVEDAWGVVKRTNYPTWLFRHSGQIAEIGRDDEGRPVISHLNRAGLLGRLDRVATWQAMKQGRLVPARPPADVVDDMLELDNPLPVLRGITGTPVFTPNGTLLTHTGYQVRTKLFYEAVGERLPDIPKTPSPEDVVRAKTILMDDWLVDFPFADAASRANALAAALTPGAREMVAGPVPLFAIDAPTPGTGKGLLAEGIGVVACGTRPSLMTEGRGEEEQRKRITAILRSGAQVIQLDNVKRRLDSAPLAAVLTTTEWTDRLLGKSEIVQVPNRSLWLATGNNLQLDGEIARRAVWIRLDPKRDRPWDRSGFRHEPLIPWVNDHRHELVWALLVLVRHWIAEGRPAWKGRLLGSFESWCRIVGGVLEAAGIYGFLENRDELYRQVDAETEEWRTFVSVWWERFSSEPVKASDLLALAMEQELLPSVFETARDNASPRALSTRMGKALGQHRDRRFGDLFIKHMGQDGHTKGALYRLEPAETTEPVVSEDEPSASSAHLPHDNESTPDSKAEHAEHAEVVFHLETENDVEDPIGEGSAKEVPHLPHLPQTDSDRADFAAEGVRNVEDHVPQDDRCPGCRKPMSVVRLNDVCGTCQAWDVVPREVILNGRRS